MLKYCLKCKRNTKNIDVKMIKTKVGRSNLSSKCASKGLLSNLGIKTPFHY